MTVSELQSILSTFPPETLVMMSGYSKMHPMSEPKLIKAEQYEDGSIWKKSSPTNEFHSIPVQVVEISYWKGEL